MFAKFRLNNRSPSQQKFMWLMNSRTDRQKTNFNKVLFFHKALKTLRISAYTGTYMYKSTFDRLDFLD